MRRPRRGPLREDICTAVVDVARFECFLRRAAELDVAKDDFKRHSDFATRKFYDCR